jgi:hypothetical protein
LDPGTVFISDLDPAFRREVDKILMIISCKNNDQNRTWFYTNFLNCRSKQLIQVTNPNADPECFEKSERESVHSGSATLVFKLKRLWDVTVQQRWYC